MNDYSISYVVSKMYVKRVNNEEVSGTAFLYKSKKNKLVLISNTHVLKDAIELEFMLHLKNKLPSFVQKIKIGGNALKNIIYNHPSEFDLCAIDISNYVNDEDLLYLLPENLLINDEGDDNIMIESFVVGYPIGLEDTLNKLPIFTSGITATSPFENFNGKPEFLINAFALPGSSGSPCFSRYNDNLILLGVVFKGNLFENDLPISNLCYAIKSYLVEEVASMVC